MSAASADIAAGWHGSLCLAFDVLDGRTVIRRRRHSGPLRIQKPFYPEDGACHVYLLHPPGGLVGGDVLTVGVELASGAAALLTTPAASKIYRSASACSVVTQEFDVARKASLEWLPNDTILFGGSRAQLRTVLRLESGARLIAADVISLGRPSSGDNYRNGQLMQSLEVYIDGSAALIERQAWSGADEVLEAAWGLSGNGVVSAFIAYPATRRTLARARALIRWTRRRHMAASLVDDLLVVRALDDDAVGLQTALRFVWAGLREAINGLEPVPPRIWAT